MSLRLNAVKHGILSKEAVLPHESKDEFEDLLAQYEADFVPANATENTLVENWQLSYGERNDF
ncbi:hypothetical protein [Parasutterella sp.]|uniref:hypothetical protein n=1 Tax=Parasutterella sp. TaxID=2049037 RepID=UPI0035217340